MLSSRKETARKKTSPQSIERSVSGIRSNLNHQEVQTARLTSTVFKNVKGPSQNEDEDLKESRLKKDALFVRGMDEKRKKQLIKKAEIAEIEISKSEMRRSDAKKVK